MRAVIVIDNNKFCDIMATKVKAACDACALPLAVEIVRDSHQVLHSLVDYDIYFIDLGENKNLGMALAEGLRNKGINGEVVLISEDEKKMKEMLHVKPCAFIFKNSLDVDIANAIAVLKKILYSSEIICIENCKKRFKFDVYSILYFRSDGHYVDVFLRNKRKELIRCTLEAILKSVEEKGFVRIHKRLIVNLKYIDKSTYDKIFLITGEVLPIGRSYSHEVKDILR